MIIDKLHCGCAKSAVNALNHSESIAAEIMLENILRRRLLFASQALGRNFFLMTLKMFIENFQYIESLSTTRN
jgi:hypothetical protein